MNFLKIYGIKNDERELIFGSIEKDALVNEGVKTAEEQGYTITEIIELPQAHNQFVESCFTERSTRKLLDRANR